MTLFSSLTDPRPAHLEQFRQVTAKARVDLSPSMRWSFLIFACTRPECPQRKLQSCLNTWGQERDFGGAVGAAAATDLHCKSIPIMESNDLSRWEENHNCLKPVKEQATSWLDLVHCPPVIAASKTNFNFTPSPRFSWCLAGFKSEIARNCEDKLSDRLKVISLALDWIDSLHVNCTFLIALQFFWPVCHLQGAILSLITRLDWPTLLTSHLFYCF